MHPTGREVARIEDVSNVPVAPSALRRDDDLIRDFCGSVISLDDFLSGSPDVRRKTVYLCGDISRISGHKLDAAARVFVVRELSHGYDEQAHQPWQLVGLGRVPIRVHGVGVYYRRFFGSDHFGRIRAEHAFQSLTESTKPGTAHRTGIYLTPVTRDGDELHFRLLRCSTNLSGPTDNFSATDSQIVAALNREAAAIFSGHAPLNHVLAQIYHNTRADAERKQSKARISAHADKTKDMPVNGIMAFCTFYDRLDRLGPLPGDPFDHGLNGVSGLTRLHFRLKAPAESPALPQRFTLTLYPDSVFFMPLSTNRLYTHEIRPSTLDAESLPIRLGYVVRCSSAEAVHKNGHTFLKRDGKLTKLEPPTPEGMNELSIGSARTPCRPIATSSRSCAHRRGSRTWGRGGRGLSWSGSARRVTCLSYAPPPDTAPRHNVSGRCTSGWPGRFRNVRGWLPASTTHSSRFTRTPTRPWAAIPTRPSIWRTSHSSLFSPATSIPRSTRRGSWSSHRRNPALRNSRFR
ncbi:hypothetical protein [Nonomuraea gerenzanensis]|uniref:Uncharacterized protein n=1 Tax=Nonomuraea gerenzanensis TaxID=93944 RepID=A0A1M4EBF2_9ACTN|nr:hypothetical protein [Nonomuraea gerenzanensis]UBU18398.1 hypothetical protein LCN96_26255 [Nonomuraea gerenzanensis]SBO96229.1 hypothetical protein BN4615_P5745 [Nonomuraea gerenzanensis]